MRAECIHSAIRRIVPPWLSDLAGAWIFYTVLPAWLWPQPSFQRIARFAPLMGLLIGALQGLLWIGLSRLGWPLAACAPCVVALGIQLSGGLHHDGLIDTADGLGAPAERRLEAMEDSRVGASGVLALVMVLLLQVGALIQLGGQAPLGLCLAAFWARVAPLWAMARFDYLRADGTAAFHRDHGRPLWDALPALLVVVVLAGWVGPTPLVLGGVVAILVAQSLGRRLGGHTGDSYGAVLVLTEMITLLGLALLLPAS